jgi:hypothetical protein
MEHGGRGTGVDVTPRVAATTSAAVQSIASSVGMVFHRSDVAVTATVAHTGGAEIHAVKIAVQAGVAAPACVKVRTDAFVLMLFLSTLCSCRQCRCSSLGS